MTREIQSHSLYDFLEEKSERRVGVETEAAFDQKETPVTEFKQERDPDQAAYSLLDQYFRADIDQQFNIVRNVVTDPTRKKYPTGVATVRDATGALDIDDPKIDQHRVEANNQLLRALGRMRGIDYVLLTKEKEAKASGNPDEVRIYQEQRLKLKKDFEALVVNTYALAEKAKEADKEAQAAALDRGAGKAAKKAAKAAAKEAATAFKKSETDFNSQTLCAVLHEAHLDEGCSEDLKSYEKLLFHYRNLASLIDPAPSLVTVSLDKTNGVLHRITQDPIARKLPEQKEAIEQELSETVIFPVGDERNVQASQKMAMQEANRCFARLAADDDRMLGAQTRKTHLRGAKNAFFVTNELLFDVTEDRLKREPGTLLDKAAEPLDTQRFTRSATPVYVGKGATDADIQESTRQNLEQVRQFIIQKMGLVGDDATNLRLHYTCLVTDSPLANQHLMIRHAYDATRRNAESSNDISYVPCNWDGTHRRLDLAEWVEEKDAPSVHPSPSNQATRYRAAAKVSAIIRGEEHIFELVACASGQDRTETESEYASQQWARSRYDAHNKKLRTEEKVDAPGQEPAPVKPLQYLVSREVKKEQGDVIEQTRAKSRNSAEITTHIVGGSRGCKNDSRGKTALIEYDNLYSKKTDRGMYLKSAKTNKHNDVDEAQLAAILAKPSALEAKEYASARAQLVQAIASPLNPQLAIAGQSVLSQVDALHATVSHKQKGALIRSLRQSALVVSGPTGPGADEKERYAEAISRLGALSQGLSHKSKLKKLGGALMVLGGLAMIAVGLLFTLPSFGGSLAGVVLGAAAIYKGKQIFLENTRSGLEAKKGLVRAIRELNEAAHIPAPAAVQEEKVREPARDDASAPTPPSPRLGSSRI